MQVVYRSAIYFTPLDAESNIDSERVKTIVNDEYAKAGMKPEDLHTGAVIITEETARKDVIVFSAYRYNNTVISLNKLVPHSQKLYLCRLEYKGKRYGDNVG